MIENVWYPQTASGIVSVRKYPPSGRFHAVSDPDTVSTRATFSLQGANARYYVVWITDLGPNESVHVDEVTAKAS